MLVSVSYTPILGVVITILKQIFHFLFYNFKFQFENFFVQFFQLNFLFRFYSSMFVNFRSNNWSDFRSVYLIFEINCPTVVNQNYEPELMPTEYVIRGNSGIMKCSVPSFVADFITVEAWVTNDGQTYARGSVESGKQNVL